MPKAVAKRQEVEIEGEQKVTFVDIAQTIDSLNFAIDQCRDEQERNVLHEELQKLMLEAAPQKLDGVGYYIADQEKDIEALKEVKRVADKKIASHQRKIERMRSLLHWVLLKLNLPKLEGRMTSVFLCDGKTGGAEIVDRSKLPPQYFMIIPAQVVPDMDKIEADLKANKEVPGARLKKGDEHIRIT